jgi:hypothetical protein
MLMRYIAHTICLYDISGVLMRYIAHTGFSDTEQQLCYFIDYNKIHLVDVQIELKQTVVCKQWIRQNSVHLLLRQHVIGT